MKWLVIPVCALLVACATDASTVVEPSSDDVPDTIEVADKDVPTRRREPVWDSGPEPPADGPLTYTDTVQPILYYYCAPCHVGDLPKSCVGDTCFVSFYESLFYDSYAPECPDMIKYQCGMVRIVNSLPDSGFEDGLTDANNERIVVSPEHLATLQAWIEAGLPE
ncbi:MAG: hypothetical protein ACI9WU_003149 [Myxococcota bacterium]